MMSSVTGSCYAKPTEATQERMLLARRILQNGLATGVKVSIVSQDSKKAVPLKSRPSSASSLLEQKVLNKKANFGYTHYSGEGVGPAHYSSGGVGLAHYRNGGVSAPENLSMSRAVSFTNLNANVNSENISISEGIFVQGNKLIK